MSQITLLAKPCGKARSFEQPAKRAQRAVALQRDPFCNHHGWFCQCKRLPFRQVGIPSPSEDFGLEGGNKFRITKHQ